MGLIKKKGLGFLGGETKKHEKQTSGATWRMKDEKKLFDRMFVCVTVVFTAYYCLRLCKF